MPTYVIAHEIVIAIALLLSFRRPYLMWTCALFGQFMVGLIYRPGAEVLLTPNGIFVLYLLTIVRWCAIWEAGRVIGASRNGIIYAASAALVMNLPLTYLCAFVPTQDVILWLMRVSSSVWMALIILVYFGIRDLSDESQHHCVAVMAYVTVFAEGSIEKILGIADEHWWTSHAVLYAFSALSLLFWIATVGLNPRRVAQALAEAASRCLHRLLALDR